MTALTPTEEQALDAMRASLIDGPRPALSPGQGEEAFTQHVLLSTRFLQAALLNKRKGDRNGEAWVRYFEEHVAAPEAKTNAQLLWDEWRTSLVKEDTPGVGIAITHGQPEIHWKTDQTLGLCLDLESMWADFDASVDHFVESLRADRARCRIILKRWRARAWSVVPFTPTDDEKAETTVSVATGIANDWSRGSTSPQVA